LTFYSNYDSISCHFWDSQRRKMSTLKLGSEVTQGHWWIVYGFLLVFFSNSVPKMHHFSDSWLVSTQWPWNTVLTFHSNHRHISYRFRDKWRFPSKIAYFSHSLYIYSPCWRGYLWNWISAQGSAKTRMMGLPDCRKSFKIRFNP